MSSMGLWDRVRACSTQLPFSPNTPASFWTKSLQARGGRVCPELGPLAHPVGCPFSNLPAWLGLQCWMGPASELLTVLRKLSSWG